jgi:hypothetical protein
MSTYLGLNRRSGEERRICDVGATTDHRGIDRRRHGSDSYVVVVVVSGVDRFGLMVGFPVAFVIAAVVLTVFVRA